MDEVAERPKVVCGAAAALHDVRMDRAAQGFNFPALLVSIVLLLDDTLTENRLTRRQGALPLVSCGSISQRWWDWPSSAANRSTDRPSSRLVSALLISPSVSVPQGSEKASGSKGTETLSHMRQNLGPPQAG